MESPTGTVSFEGVERVVAEPLRFKAKLAIGENAYASLRLINRSREVWDVLGAAGAGAAVAKSSLVASTFFAPSGVLGALGLGTAATPVGWVALAALASGGACYGLYRWLGNTKGSRVIEIPRYLNTPLDTLGLALFDLIAPLALRLAAVDGQIEPGERQALMSHLVDEWGLDAAFVAQAVAQIEPGVLQGSVTEMATELSTFLHANPDCNHAAIAEDLAQFLRSLLEAGGPLTPAETEALALTLERLRETPDTPLSRAWTQARAGAGKAVDQVGASARKAADWTRERLPTPQALQAAAAESATQVQQTARKATAWAQETLPVAAEQVGQAARRSVDVARTGIDQLKRRVRRLPRRP